MAHRFRRITRALQQEFGGSYTGLLRWVDQNQAVIAQKAKTSGNWRAAAIELYRLGQLAEKSLAQKTPDEDD